jgi:ribosome-associated protein
MDIRKLQRAIVDGLEDVKALDIRVFNTEHLSPLFERVIVASGASNRQTKALASSVRETVKKRGLPVMRTEGEDNGEWIIVDCGAAVAHIMQPAIRQYYNLEEIWGDKPVHLKLSETAPGAPRQTPATATRSASRRGAAQGDSKKSDAKKSAKQTAAKQTAAKKGLAGGAAGSSSRAVTRRPSAGTPAAKKVGARKPAAKPPAAKRPAKKGAATKTDRARRRA